MSKVVLSILVNNTSGVLSRVAGLFSRRGYNIDSLTVGETENPAFSRMTVSVTGDDIVLEQIEKQVNKLEDVKSVKQLTGEASQICFAEGAVTASRGSYGKGMDSFSFTKGWSLAVSAGPAQQKRHWKSLRSSTVR